MPHMNEPGLLELFDVRRLVVHSRSGLDIPIQIGFLLLVLLIALSAWLNYQHTALVFENESYLAHTHRVIGEERGILTELVSAESGARGYLLSGDPAHLEPYELSRRSLPDRLAVLQQLTRDDAEQSSFAQVLQMRVEARVRSLDGIVAGGPAGIRDEAARSKSTNDANRLMDDVRAVVAQFEAREQARLLDRESRVRASYHTARTTGLVLGISGIVLVVLVYNFVRRFERLRHLAAREVADARERFQVTLGSIGDAVLVVDTEGRLAFCNDRCRSLMRIGPESIGRQVDELATWIAESGDEPRDSLFRRALAEHGVHRAAGDTAIQLPDGTRIPVEANASTILGHEGAVQGAVLVLRDVSERRDRERELARSIERFRSLVAATAQVVWTTDASGHVREDSPSWRKLTGQSYEQFQGMGGVDVLHPDDRARAVLAWTTAVAERSRYEIEYRLRTADGTYRWSMARAVPVLDTDGSVREWVGMIRDIHERKVSESAQETEHRRKDDFIALLAHEIRNPLAPLRNGLELLKAGVPSAMPPALEMMDRQIRHMVRLIDDLLDVSRISQGKFELRLEQIDLRDVLRQSVDAVRPAIEKKKQILTVSLPTAPMWVKGDPERLTQVIGNLLNNAMKYSGEAAAIWLTAEREGSRLLVSIRDTGQGIPTDLRPRIWDLFRQGEGRVERVEGGLGIGLTLVKQLVEMHEGTVEVQSEGVGTGSEFTLRLPAAVRQSDHTPERGSVRVNAASRALRILVIDDNEDAAESLSMLLRISGHFVRTAFGGDDGVVECQRFSPELLLCDIRMPDVSGYEVARRLRTLPGARPFLVALTGFGADSDRAASLRAGFDRHLVKPVDPEELSTLIHEVALGFPQSSETP